MSVWTGVFKYLLIRPNVSATDDLAFSMSQVIFIMGLSYSIPYRHVCTLSPYSGIAITCTCVCSNPTWVQLFQLFSGLVLCCFVFLLECHIIHMCASHSRVYIILSCTRSDSGKGKWKYMRIRMCNQGDQPISADQAAWAVFESGLHGWQSYLNSTICLACTCMYIPVWLSR